jgi:hypothetical protein
MAEQFNTEQRVDPRKVTMRSLGAQGMTFRSSGSATGMLGKVSSGLTLAHAWVTGILFCICGVGAIGFAIYLRAYWQILAGIVCIVIGVGGIFLTQRSVRRGRELVKRVEAGDSDVQFMEFWGEKVPVKVSTNAAWLNSPAGRIALPLFVVVAFGGVGLVAVYPHVLRGAGFTLGLWAGMWLICVAVTLVVFEIREVVARFRATPEDENLRYWLSWASTKNHSRLNAKTMARAAALAWSRSGNRAVAEAAAEAAVQRNGRLGKILVLGIFPVLALILSLLPAPL